MSVGFLQMTKPHVKLLLSAVPLSEETHLEETGTVAKNERNTEAIVRDHFVLDPYVGLVIEEQTTEDRRIKRALAAASKSGSGVGHPEFIIHAPTEPNLVVLVECKANTSDHESQNQDQAAKNAVDGVLHYARHVSKVRDVIGIAVSGQSKRELKVSTYLHLKGADAAVELSDQNGAINALVDFASLIRAMNFDPEKRKASLETLLAFSRDLHDKMRDDAKLTEQEKPLVVSGILIGLNDRSFKLSFSELHYDEIGDRLIEAITRELERAKMPNAKVQRIVQPYSFIANHESLNVVLPGQALSPLQTYCADLAEHVLPYVNTYGEEDVVGRFYAEFLRYAGDKKGLGIVLTPKHVTELFCDLAELSVNDTVLDNCAGTGGFLISAMTRMDELATTAKQRQNIRENQLVGIEQQAMMFALAASNMLLRGDGKANLYHRSGLDVATQKEVVSGKNHPRPTKGMVNPPYSQKGDGLHELDFVESMLEMLTPGGIGVAVVPMSCGIEPSPQKRRLLESHTLLAAMSMPDQLFYPVAAVTCILVFKAHHPHIGSGSDTWFGYWKDDGFKLTRVHGRADADHRWQGIRPAWINDYKRRIESPGRSVLRMVDALDEWCAEAYLETDYSIIDGALLATVARRYAMHRAMVALGDNREEEAV